MTNSIVLQAWQGALVACAWLARVVILSIGTAVAVSAEPIGLAWGDGSLWVSDRETGTIYDLDPFSDTVIHAFTPPFFAGDRIRDLAWDGNRVWAAYWADPATSTSDLPGKVYAFDPLDGSIEASFAAPFSGHPDGLAYDGSLLWVGEEDGLVYGIDPHSGIVVRSFVPPTASISNPRGIAWDGEAFWLGYQGITNDQIRRVDGSGNVLSAVDSPYGGCQQGLAYDGTNLWTTGSCGTVSISQIDPRTGAIRYSFASHVFPLPPQPVPEPSTFSMLGMGAVIGVLARSRHRERLPTPR